MASRVLLVDAYNMIHRARFGFGTGPHAMTFNFFRAMRSEFNRHSPDKVYIVSEGRPVHRIEESSGNYKGNRNNVLGDDFHRQKREIFELCKLIPVTITRHPDYECDDVIGTLSERYSKEGKEVVICSSDSDFIQLLTLRNVSLWNPVKKKFIEEWPVDYLTWKSLKGDPTDNIPGVKGVGTKTADKLAACPNLLQDFFEKKPGTKESYESARRQIKLVNIPESCPKWESFDYFFSEKKLFEEFKQRQFKTIVGNAWPKWINTMESING